MFTKSFIPAIAAVLVIPAIALSSAAYGGQVYQGGPKSGLTARTQTFEANKPYAQAVKDTSAATHQHVYQGGPNTMVPHGQR